MISQTEIETLLRACAAISWSISASAPRTTAAGSEQQSSRTKRAGRLVLTYDMDDRPIASWSPANG